MWIYFFNCVDINVFQQKFDFVVEMVVFIFGLVFCLVVYSVVGICQIFVERNIDLVGCIIVGEIVDQ